MPLVEYIASLVLDLRRNKNKPDKLRLVQDEVIRQALRRTEGNKSAAARLLGMERKAFCRKADKIR
jgi:DNA-binding NtrC family response regulator